MPSAEDRLHSLWCLSLCNTTLSLKEWGSILGTDRTIAEIGGYMKRNSIRPISIRKCVYDLVSFLSFFKIGFLHELSGGANTKLLNRVTEIKVRADPIHFQVLLESRRLPSQSQFSAFELSFPLSPPPPSPSISISWLRAGRWGEQ